MNDKEILAGLKNSQVTAFRQLFDAYYDVLVLFANHLLNDAEASEDVVQECFVDFWTHRRYENILDGLDKYLFQAVKHAALNFIRGNQRRLKRHALAVEYAAEENTNVEMYEEELEQLYTTINRLPEERKKIFMMICLEGKKYQEVADLLNISINTVKTQMGRAFQFLRQVLEDGKISILLLILWRGQGKLD